MGVIKAFEILPGLSAKLTGEKDANKTIIMQSLVKYEDTDRKALANIILDYIKSEQLQDFINRQTGRDDEILNALLYLDEYYARLTA